MSKALKSALCALEKSHWLAERVALDPVSLLRPYRDPRDQEVVGLLAVSLAYGRASNFIPKCWAMLQPLGPRPAQWLQKAGLLDVQTALRGFVYRFNTAADLGRLWLAIGQVLRQHGSLEALYLRARQQRGPGHGAVLGFCGLLRDGVPREAKKLGPTRAFSHLIPHPQSASAAKRMHLYLRWMVRGPDALDVGAWKNVSKAELEMPLDTHVFRIARHLGLTARKSPNALAAREVAQALAEVDPTDPVRFDFAICHLGMSGRCPLKPAKENCRKCPLLKVCNTGRRMTGF